ncbi:hypothetical protein KCV01_g20332, partial [Aureobasidium melanogenum]
MPAPSPSTSPVRSALNGRQVPTASTRIASQAFNALKLKHASVPPQIATSAMPQRMSDMAWAMAWLLDAQALATTKAGPRVPWAMLIWLAGALIISLTMVRGWMRPEFPAYNCLACSSCVVSPPAPVPTITAVRSASSPWRRSMPDCRTASSAATQANCDTRSSIDNRLASKCAAGSQSGGTCAASGARMFAASGWCNGRMPSRPPRAASHSTCAPTPSALIAPMPVMTTRRVDIVSGMLAMGRRMRRGRGSRGVARVTRRKRLLHRLHQIPNGFSRDVGVVELYLMPDFLLQILFHIEEDFDHIDRRQAKLGELGRASDRRGMTLGLLDHVMGDHT